MPLPRWLAKINKRVFNKLELKRGVRPVITHVGRSSGKTYRTPLDAHRADGSFIFIVMYGSSSDWVRNILASSTAQLDIGGDHYQLVSPRLISKDAAWQQLPGTARPPPGWLNVSEYLQMDVRS
jgi:deazaflavin-dependent oxidoreductase (nitroreductase family)